MIDLPGGEVLEGQQPYEALYIHIPFCKSKCAYCDFASEAVSADDPRIEAYIDELILSIRAASRADLLGDLKTVYIGRRDAYPHRQQAALALDLCALALDAPYP